MNWITNEDTKKFGKPEGKPVRTRLLFALPAEHIEVRSFLSFDSFELGDESSKVSVA